jgi:hypothetical protein
MVKASAYILATIIVSAAFYALISLTNLYILEPEPVEIDNTTVYVLKEQSLNPTSVALAIYSIALMAALPAILYGCMMDRRWVLRPAAVGGILSIGIFPIGTVMGPLVTYFMTRPVVKHWIGTSPPPTDQGSPYGLEGAPPLSPR